MKFFLRLLTRPGRLVRTDVELSVAHLCMCMGSYLNSIGMDMGIAMRSEMGVGLSLICGSVAEGCRFVSACCERTPWCTAATVMYWYVELLAYGSLLICVIHAH